MYTTLPETYKLNDDYAIISITNNNKSGIVVAI
jgi:hypothetical protein